MSINHKLIKNIIQGIVIVLFVISITRKLKDILLMGGTKKISDELENDEDSPEDDPEDIPLRAPIVETTQAPPPPPVFDNE